MSQNENKAELSEEETQILEKNKKLAQEKLEQERLEKEKIEKRELEYDKENPIFDGISHFYEYVEYENDAKMDKKIDEIQVLKEKLTAEYEAQKKKAEEIALENQKSEKTKKVKEEKVYFEKNFGKVVSWKDA